MNDIHPTKDPDLSDMLRDIGRAKLHIMAGVVLGLIGMALLIGFATPHYRATLLISPSDSINGAEISSQLAGDNVFALRYLIQRVGLTKSTSFLRFEHIHDAPSVAAILIKDEDIKDGVENDISFAFLGKQDINNAADLSKYLQSKVSLSSVGTSSLRRLSYHHPDPVFAAFMLHKIHSATDNLIRQSVIQDTTERIEYLQATLSASRNPEHRKTLTTLLLEQERTKMLASIDQPYAAAIIEPPSASPKPVWPDRFMIFTIFVLSGAFLGFMVWRIKQS